MQTKKTIIKLPHNILGRKEVVEEPLLSERLNVRAEDRERIGPKSSGLVDSYENIFDFKGRELKISGP